MKTSFDLTGQRFTRLVVLGANEQRRREAHWFCICDCGKKVSVRSYNLRKGITKSCGCFKVDTLNQNWAKKVAPNQAAINRVLKQYISNAVNRGFSFQLTRDEFIKLSQQNCHYCNVPPSTTRTTPRGSFTYNGLDRVNNENGYTSDNVVTCCGRCNRMKREMSYEMFIIHIKQIADHTKELSV